MTTFKKLFALFVAILMIAGLCVPIYAVDPEADTCTCDEPWPENPQEYEDPYIIDKDDDVHIWAQDYMQQCSRCNLYYVEVGRTWEEPHYGVLFPVRLSDGSIILFGTCNVPGCGVEYYVTP